MTEHHLQAAFFDWVFIKQKTDPRYQWIFAVPNGGARHIATAVKLKREGVRRGVLDVIIPIASKGYVGAVIEFKVGKNKASPEQECWLKHFESQNWLTTVIVDDVEKAINFTTNYLGKYTTLEQSFNNLMGDGARATQQEEQN